MRNSVRLLLLPIPAAFLTASDTTDKIPGLVVGEIGEESRVLVHESSVWPVFCTKKKDLHYRLLGGIIYRHIYLRK